MESKWLCVSIILVLLSSFVAGHGEEEHSNFSDAIEIIENKVACDELSDDQMERLGDYYMEQIHPGEAHIRMDAMMGGEDSESLRQAHINMGERFYCGSQIEESYMGHPPLFRNYTPLLITALLVGAGIIAVVFLKRD